MAICAGASQIALMAEEKSHSRFLFAPSLTLRNEDYDETFVFNAGMSGMEF